MKTIRDLDVQTVTGLTGSLPGFRFVSPFACCLHVPLLLVPQKGLPRPCEPTDFKRMKPYYRNSALQMDDPEMESLQRFDAGACAVWEWLKGDAAKRNSPQIRKLSSTEKTVLAERLGITGQRMDSILDEMRRIGWIQDECIRSWNKWQAGRTPEEDAMRKQVEYWKAKATAQQSQLLPFSQNLPLPPKNNMMKEAREVLDYLNERTKRQFRPVESNLKLIAARLAEPGVLVAEVKVMIDRQALRWMGTSMEEYLRPETLFAKSKFDSYYSARYLPAHPASENGLSPAAKLRMLEDLIAKHPANTKSTYYNPKHSVAQREELRQLRMKVEKFKAEMVQ